jgi:hypothetical protein
MAIAQVQIKNKKIQLKKKIKNSIKNKKKLNLNYKRKKGAITTCADACFCLHNYPKVIDHLALVGLVL